MKHATKVEIPLPPITITAPPTPISVRTETAAAMLGLSRDSFERHIMHNLKAVYVGSVRLYRVAELERWAKENET